MESSYLLAGGILVLAVIALSVGIASSGDLGEKSCETIYNQAVEGEIEAGEIPERCEPVPSDVQRRLLAGALTGSAGQ